MSQATKSPAQDNPIVLHPQNGEPIPPALLAVMLAHCANWLSASYADASIDALLAPFRIDAQGFSGLKSPAPRGKHTRRVGSAVRSAASVPGHIVAHSMTEKEWNAYRAAAKTSRAPAVLGAILTAWKSPSAQSAGFQVRD